MLISASFRYGQLKSIKNQSHPHFHFDTHRSGVLGKGDEKDKLNKTSTEIDHGVLNDFTILLFHAVCNAMFANPRQKHKVAQFLSLIFTHI